MSKISFKDAITALTSEGFAVLLMPAPFQDVKTIEATSPRQVPSAPASKALPATAPVKAAEGDKPATGKGKGKYKCGLCGELSHNARTCELNPNRKGKDKAAPSKAASKPKATPKPPVEADPSPEEMLADLGEMELDDFAGDLDLDFSDLGDEEEKQETVEAAAEEAEDEEVSEADFENLFSSADNLDGEETEPEPETSSADLDSALDEALTSFLV